MIWETAPLERDRGYRLPKVYSVLNEKQLLLATTFSAYRE